MQKFIEYLERYVQWIALALGALYLACMGWSYLSKPPISESLKNPAMVVTPQDIDHVTLERVANPLETAMKNDRDVPPMSVKPFTRQFQMAMDEGSTPTAPLAGGPWIGQATQSKYEKIDYKGPDVIQRISQLPIPPKATWLGFSQGRSTIMRPDPSNPTSANTITEDRDWVTEAFVISAAKLSEAFRQANVPAVLPTAFLQVELIRQEQLPDGTWGNEIALAPLPIHNVPAFPPAGDKAAELQHLDWASRNTITIILPGFYAGVKGEVWYAPGQPNPNIVIPVKTVVEPVIPKEPVKPRVVPQPKAPRMPNRPNFRNSPPPPMGSMSKAGSRTRYSSVIHASAPNSEPRILLAQNAPYPGNYPQIDPGMASGMPGNLNGMGMPSAPNVPANATTPLPGYMAPSGTFTLSQLTADILVWAHDDSAKPDKTYRYKLRYKLKNPAYRTNFTDTPQLALQFALTSEDSDWSPTVKVLPNVNFFVAGGIVPNSSTAKFDVFKWQNGDWHMKTFSVSAGDIIGSVDKSAADKTAAVASQEIDYTTGWTLVDIAPNGATRDSRIILSDTNGKLEYRDYKSDQAKDLYKELLRKTGNAKVPQPVVPPGEMPPGMMPGNP